MKTKQISDFNTSVADVIDYKLKKENFQENIDGVQVDATLIPVHRDNNGGTQRAARYVITDILNLHANFEVVNMTKKFVGYDQNGIPQFSAVAANDNDIVEWMYTEFDVNGNPTGGACFVVVADADVEFSLNDMMTVNIADHKLWKWDNGTASWSDSGLAYEAPFTQAVARFFGDDDGGTLAADTEITYTLPDSKVCKAGFIPIVSVAGVMLDEDDTTVTGANGFSFTEGSGDIKVRVPYTIDPSEVVRVVFVW